MRNIDVFKKGKIIETSPYYNFDTENYTDMSYLIEYENKMYQVICDSIGTVIDPEEECLAIVDDLNNIESDNESEFNKNLIGMTSDSGLSLSALFSNFTINENFDEFD